MKPWQRIPMQEFSNLSVIQDESGEVIATVNNQYAESVRALPELLSATQETLKDLKKHYRNWQTQTSLASLERMLLKLKNYPQRG